MGRRNGLEERLMIHNIATVSDFSKKVSLLGTQFEKLSLIENVFLFAIVRSA